MKATRFLTSIFLFIPLMLSACSGGQPQATPTLVPTPVAIEKPVYEVKRGTVTRTVTLNGRVRPERQRDLFFREDGFVQDVLVSEGESVREEQVLARLDDPERYKADLSAARLAVAQAERDLEQAKLEAPVRLAEAQLALLQAEEDLEAAVEEREAMWPWSAEIPQAEARITLAQALYEKAEANVKRLSGEGKDSAVRLAELALSDAKARLSLAQKALENIELKAPFSGQVTSIGIGPGSSVTAFQSVMTLSDPANLEIQAMPDLETLQLLGAGQRGIVRLSSHPGEEFPVQVSDISPGSSSDVGRDNAQVVHFEIEGTAVELETDSSATIELNIETREDALWLPPAAIRTFQDQDFVYVETGGVQRRVNISIGLRSAERVEILSGLNEGQTVVGE